MSQDPDDLAARARRRKLRAALDDLAPDPVAVSDRDSDATGRGREEPAEGGRSKEELERERPPHHGG